MEWTNALRWVHVLAAAAWFGEVVVINLLLVPIAIKRRGAERLGFLTELFPKVFRLASYLSLIAVTTGFILLLDRFWGHWEGLVSGARGVALLAGLSLATALTVFHFLVEPRLDGMICHAAEREDFEMSDKVVRLLSVVPRAGLAVITSIMLLMMYGARGL